jgi:hypothetical protein
MPRQKSPKTVARIETNTARFSRAEVPCPICGYQLRVKIDRRGKPYVGCLPCGVQLFVRRERGIKLLLDTLRAPRPSRRTSNGNRLTELING